MICRTPYQRGEDRRRGLLLSPISLFIPFSPPSVSNKGNGIPFLFPPPPPSPNVVCEKRFPFLVFLVCGKTTNVCRTLAERRSSVRVVATKLFLWCWCWFGPKQKQQGHRTTEGGRRGGANNASKSQRRRNKKNFFYLLCRVLLSPIFPQRRLTFSLPLLSLSLLLRKNIMWLGNTSSDQKSCLLQENSKYVFFHSRFFWNSSANNKCPFSLVPPLNSAQKTRTFLPQGRQRRSRVCFL